MYCAIPFLLPFTVINRKLEFSGEKLKRESIWISKIENLKFIVHESDLYGK